MSENKVFSKYNVMRGLRKVDKYLKGGADVLSLVAKFQKAPTPAGLFHLGTKLVRQGLSTEFFDKYRPYNWPAYHPGEEHFQTLLEILQEFPHQSFGDNADDRVTFYKVYGVTIVHEYRARDYFRFLEDETSREQLSCILARAVWDICGSPCALRTKTNNKSNSWLSVVIDYLPRPPLIKYESEACKEITTRIKSFLDKGVSRSIILNGPPGTGKTTMINNIASQFGERVLIIDVADIHYISATMLSKRVRWLSPDVLVVNDLDRFSNSSSMLGTLEEMNTYLKLLLISVNDITKIDKAAIRPGRFDETFNVENLDEPVVKEILGDNQEVINEEVFNEIKLWPAAFIAELSKRLTCLGPDCLQAELEALRERVKTNNKEEEKELPDTKKKK